jgi:hypothetical protein
VAIDGKAVRRSFDRQKGHAPLHRVSACATEGKGGELAVLPDLLGGPDLRVCSSKPPSRLSPLRERMIAAGDHGEPGRPRLPGRGRRAHRGSGRRRPAGAQGQPQEGARRGKGLVRRERVRARRAAPPFFDAFDDGHGRLARRRVLACPDAGVLTTLKDWPGLRAVPAVETIRGIPGRGKVMAEIRHDLSSAALPPEALAVAIRNHGRMENGLPWVLDVTFREARRRSC